ncbi:helix-turn-helix transcriptional regulator [Streptomyces sp. NP160]|uniref:TetR/AcrR family transcriptional regulator n=1 Tax=Streptomyces sp. NP160 TaxID=2586637 RepID=UPI001117F902|nr:TetR/AcrR family transcriptional regulator [Streptomyces sp. NP160]TNM59339.1 helix-turn-helix transcriptional regulator [Streptomyces sp. NP160]
MGRPAGFEEAAAVRAARRVFWRHGFEQASVPDLERATGLGRSSLYHAFGSKRGLYDAALASYLDEVVRPRLRPLQEPPVAPGALATYLERLHAALTTPHALDAGDGDDAVHGCLLLNAGTAPIGQDEAVRAVVAAYRRELRAAVADGLAAARPDLADDARGQLAESVTALVVAALALVRVDPGAAGDSLRTALAAARPRRPGEDDHPRG